jgi:hypothetical protein
MRYLQIDQGEKDASQDFGPDCRGRRVMYLTGDVKLVGTSKLETILSSRLGDTGRQVLHMP